MTWFLHDDSHRVRWRHLVVHFVLENRYAAPVASCLRVAGPIDEEIVEDFVPFALYFQLVAALDSGPTDGAVGVRCDDGVQGGVSTLQGPAQRHRHVHVFHLTYQLHRFPHRHSVVSTNKLDLQE